jgi:Nucleoporin protein Ndc1-Nup
LPRACSMIKYRKCVQLFLKQGCVSKFTLQPLAIASHTADPILTLISGVTSGDPYYVHFSYMELRTLAENDGTAASIRRSTLFGDQKHNPTLWATLVRTALLTLGKDYQVLLHRGAPPPPLGLLSSPYYCSRADQRPSSCAETEAGIRRSSCARYSFRSEICLQEYTKFTPAFGCRVVGRRRSGDTGTRAFSR